MREPSCTSKDRGSRFTSLDRKHPLSRRLLGAAAPAARAARPGPALIVAPALRADLPAQHSLRGPYATLVFIRTGAVGDANRAICKGVRPSPDRTASCWLHGELTR
jgi:hypothetical protein